MDFVLNANEWYIYQILFEIDEVHRLFTFKIKFAPRSNTKCIDEHWVNHFNFSGIREHISSFLNGRNDSKQNSLPSFQLHIHLSVFVFVYNLHSTTHCAFHCENNSNSEADFKWMRLKLDAKHVSYSVSFNSRKQFLFNAIITSMIMILLQIFAMKPVNIFYAFGIMNKSNLMQ